jgi:hypothetical protein
MRTADFAIKSDSGVVMPGSGTVFEGIGGRHTEGPRIVGAATQIAA